MVGTYDRDPVCNFVIMGRSWGGVVKQNVNREKQIFCLGHKRRVWGKKLSGVEWSGAEWSRGVESVL